MVQKLEVLDKAHIKFVCTMQIINAKVCDDADEKEYDCKTKNGGCSAHARCTGTVGSIKCACQPGYTGNGFNCTGKTASEELTTN